MGSVLHSLPPLNSSCSGIIENQMAMMSSHVRSSASGSVWDEDEESSEYKFSSLTGSSKGHMVTPSDVSSDTCVLIMFHP